MSDEENEDEQLRYETEMSDYRDTQSFHVGYAAHAVSQAVHHICELARSYPHLTRLELAALSNANDQLAELIAKLTVREAAE